MEQTQMDRSAQAYSRGFARGKLFARLQMAGVAACALVIWVLAGILLPV